MLIASCSKSFVAVALAILMDDVIHRRNLGSLPNCLKSLDWNTRLKDILPGSFGLMDKIAHELVTIRDALCHMTGLAGSVVFLNRIS
jgi:CubicO group peptidase (beta-lactamase class C family)